MYQPTIELLQDHVAMVRTGLYAFPTAIIAGGAVRDITMGKPVRDIDLFVECNSDAEIEGEDSEFAAFCRQMAARIDCEATFAPSNPEYGNLWDLCKLTPKWPTELNFGLDWDIVAIDRDPTDDVYLYDFGLSQMFVTPAGRFMSDHAIADLTRRTITYTPVVQPDPWSIVRSRKRLERLQEKYSTSVLFQNVHAFSLIPLGMTGDVLAADVDRLKDFYSRIQGVNRV